MWYIREMMNKNQKTHDIPSDDGEVSGTLPAQYIRALKDKLDEKQQLYERLPKEIAECKRIYEAALIFAPKNFNPTALPSFEKLSEPFQQVIENAGLAIEKKSRAERKSWASSVRSVLDSATVGMNRKALFEAVRQHSPDLPVSTGEKGYYNAIAKVAERGQLIKHGDLLFSSKLVEEMKSRGEDLPEQIGQRVRSGSSADFVINALKDCPDGLTAQELKKKVGGNSEAPKSIREHGQYIYHILTTLIGSGTVVKKGNLYSLAITTGAVSPQTHKN